VASQFFEAQLKRLEAEEHQASTGREKERVAVDGIAVLWTAASAGIGYKGSDDGGAESGTTSPPTTSSDQADEVLHMFLPLMSSAFSTLRSRPRDCARDHALLR
jgi:hypothetical protein